MVRRSCACVIALVLAAYAHEAYANPQSIVRVDATQGDSTLSGVTVASDVIVAPAGALADGAAVSIQRDTDTAQASAAVLRGVAIIRLSGGNAATAQISRDDAPNATSLDVFYMQQGGVQRVSGLMSVTAEDTRVVDAPEGGGVAFNGCGEVVALIGPGGVIVPASTIAAALESEGVAFQRATEACGAMADGGVSALQSEVENLRRQLAERNTEARRRQIENRIAALQQQINTELETQARQRSAIETAAREAEQKQQSDRELAKRIAIGVGAGVLALLALAVWLFIRSRKLNKSLTEARKGGPKWNDCVLESASGLTVKLPGAKLAQGGVVVGRSREDCDVVIDKDDVSRRHARFEVLDDALHVSDLGSTNKTFVNGTELQRAIVKRLHEGDKVAIGSNEFVVRILRGKNS